MKIGLLSDTHSYLDDKIFYHFKDCDEIWHAGDVGADNVLDQLREFKPVRAVFGNIDGGIVRQTCSEDLLFEVSGLRVFMTHIGGYPPKYAGRVRSVLKAEQPDLYICGHSHILKIMRDPALNNLLHINPGAAGRHGFQQMRTLVRFDVAAGVISNVQVIELGKRV